MTNDSQTQNDTAVLDALPSNPLSETAIQTLQNHDKISDCIPLYDLAADSNKIVAVLLKHNESTVVVVFNPETEQWEDIFHTATFSNVYGDDATSARNAFVDNLGRVYELYDASNIRMRDPADAEMFAVEGNSFKNLLTGLPDTPLSSATLEKFKNEDDVIEVIPHLYLRDTNNTVFLSITFDDVVERERRFGLAFFDKDAEEWVGTFSMDAERLNDPADTEFEEAFNTAFDVVEEAYGSHVLGVIQSEADYRDWIPGTPVHDERPEQA